MTPLSEQHASEIRSMTSTELRAVVSIMRCQATAMFFVGDRDRSKAIHDAAKAELESRKEMTSAL